MWLGGKWATKQKLHDLSPKRNLHNVSSLAAGYWQLLLPSNSSEPLNGNILTDLNHGEREEEMTFIKGPPRTKYFTYIFSFDLHSYEMSIITSHLQMRKQNQKVKEEFQNLATGVWVEPKSVTRVFAFGSLCSALPPSIQGFWGALWLRASGVGDTEQNSRSEAWVSLKQDHARILTSGSVTKGGPSLKAEQCCWRRFH